MNSTTTTTTAPAAATTTTTTNARPEMSRARMSEWCRSPHPGGSQSFDSSIDRQDSIDDRVVAAHDDTTVRGLGLSPSLYSLRRQRHNATILPSKQQSGPEPAKPAKPAKATAKTATAANARSLAQRDDNAPSFPLPLDTVDIRQTLEIDRVSETCENPGSLFQHDSNFQGYRYLHSQSVESFLTSPVSSILPPAQSPIPAEGTSSGSTTRSGTGGGGEKPGEGVMATAASILPVGGSFYHKLARKLSTDGAGQHPGLPRRQQQQQQQQQKESKDNWSISKFFNKGRKRPNKTSPVPAPTPESTSRYQSPSPTFTSLQTSPISFSNLHHHNNNHYHPSIGDRSPPQIPPVLAQESHLVYPHTEPPFDSPPSGPMIEQPPTIPAKSNRRTSADVSNTLEQLQSSYQPTGATKEDDNTEREQTMVIRSPAEGRTSQSYSNEKFGVSTYISAGDDNSAEEREPKRKVNWRSTAGGLANNLKGTGPASGAKASGLSRSRSLLRFPKHSNNDALRAVRRASSEAEPLYLPNLAFENVSLSMPIADQENAPVRQQPNGISSTTTATTPKKSPPVAKPVDDTPRPATAVNPKTLATLGCPPRKPVTSISREETSSAKQSESANGEPKKRTLEQRIEDVQSSIRDMERKESHTQRNLTTLNGIDMRFDLVRQRKKELEEDLATLKADLHMHGLILNRLMRKKDEKDIGSPDGLWVRRIG